MQHLSSLFASLIIANKKALKTHLAYEGFPCLLHVVRYIFDVILNRDVTSSHSLTGLERPCFIKRGGWV